METKKENPDPRPAQPSLLRNWMSLIGLVMVIGALFSFLQLFILDTVAHFSNPYISILTWMVAPAFLVLGLFLTVVGELRERRRRKGGVSLMSMVQVDLSRPRDRRNMAIFLSGAVLFLLLSAIGSYNSYQFTESVQFCGETCHTVMKPELTAHALGPHARVACAECHIGPGASWFVRSKLSGSYQVYAVLFDKYPRPIPTPIANLRPARETCEQCHWPNQFIGNLDQTTHYFLSDRLEHALFHSHDAQSGRKRSLARGCWRHSLAHVRQQPRGVCRGGSGPAENRLGADDGCAGCGDGFQNEEFHQRRPQRRNPHDGLHRLPQSSLAPVHVAGQRGGSRHGSRPDTARPAVDQNQRRLCPDPQIQHRHGSP